MLFEKVILLEIIQAEFLVVGNSDEIRGSHTLPDRIGEKIIGDDNQQALNEGMSYISKQFRTIYF